MQGRNGDIDVEMGLVDTVGERVRGINGESSINIYTLLCVKWIVDEKLLYKTGSPAWHSVMTQKSGMSGESSIDIYTLPYVNR